MYGETVTLAGVTLSVGSGETWAVCGPNGSGKSTLLRVMAGALRPTSGHVRLFGEPIASLGRAKVARVMALVPQDTGVAFGFTVGEVVAMGRAPFGRDWRALGAEDKRVIERELARADLTAMARVPMQELSGGEQRRVALARALVQEPKVLLLDEPTASLDVRHEARFFATLSELGRAGLATVLVLHDFAAAARTASHALLLARGHVVASGPAAEVLQRARLAEAFGVELEERSALVAVARG